MSWYCVLIEHERLGKPLDATFRNMLVDEFQKADCPADWVIFRRGAQPGVNVYYFSPHTYMAMKPFVDFWHGYECKPPSIQAPLDIISCEIASIQPIPVDTPISSTL